MTRDARMRSGLQRQVLSVYKRSLRAAKNKPGFYENVRSEFRRNAAAVAKQDVMHIEHLLRKAEKKIKLMTDEFVQSVRTVRATDRPESK
ncbi:unnamed protein product [Notodromas monacha]|uniref:Complex 1 LYR protein domain-containing protein n=1 Tax=Notodromas monacha TaxID=399045 RepID=A0A7R9GD50_9CRUS|nr:unnamed protein product [Notodromas monacha]CAG0916548.1 unnamed protein product [Notodromas monacha]